MINHVYKNNLKTAIKQRGFKLNEVAQGTDIPLRSLSDYCAGRVPIPQKRLEDVAKFIGCSVSYMRGDTIIPEGQSTVNRGSDEMNRKRRVLLQSLSIAGSALLISPEIDWERFENVVEKPSSVGNEFLEDLENINDRYWKVFLSISPKAMVLDGVQGHLNVLIPFLKEAYPLSIHKRLCGLVSSLAQLAGEVCFDVGDYHTALSCYTLAASSAKEAGQYDLWACSLIRSAFLSLYSGQDDAALTLLKESRRITYLGDSTMVTRFWAAAVEAEAQASMHNLSACQSAIEEAHTVLSMDTGFNNTWLRFDGSRLSELQGACFVRLQRPDLAFPALEKALTQNAKPTRRRGMVLTDLARASIQRGEIEQACDYAHEMVNIALQGSGVLKKCTQSLSHQFEPFGDVDVVHQLNQHMLSLT